MTAKESRITKTTHSLMELDFGYVPTEEQPILEKLTQKRDIFYQCCKVYPISIDHNFHGAQGGEKTVYSIVFADEVSDQEADALLAYLKQQLQRLTMLRDDLNILSAASKKKAAEK